MTIGDNQPSSTGGERVISKNVRTETRGSGANAVTKTIVTETIIGPDGQKRTVTKETVTSGSDAAPSGQDDVRFSIA